MIPKATGYRRPSRATYGAAVPSAVVLLGPPGSGKTTVGRLLAVRGLRWREWEQWLVDRWGTREAFLADKERALSELHDEVVEWATSDDTPAVLETTGLSDAPLLVRLRSSVATVVIRLDVSEDEAMRRVAARAPGEHLTDDVERSRAVWRAFCDHVAGAVEVDLAIDTERVAADVATEMILGQVLPKA